MSDIDFVVSEPKSAKLVSENIVEVSSSLTCPSSHTWSTWDKIMEDYDCDRQEVEDYLNKRNGVEGKITCEQYPVITYLNDNVFPLICQGLIKMLDRVREEKCFYRQKSAFNGTDFLSEYIFNMNPRHPERKENWTDFFDIQWVQDHLEKFPRPYYPFSLIWSREYAALKIQAYMRGYWVRRRTDVQEMRNFWRHYIPT